MTTEKPSKKRAALAILFAGGLLHSQQPALSKPVPSLVAKESVVAQLVESPKCSPQQRAEWLLRLSIAYLGNETDAEVENRFRKVVGELDRGSFGFGRRRNDFLIMDAQRAATGEAFKSKPSQVGAADKSRSTESSARRKSLALHALEAALYQIDLTPDVLARLNLYFIASCVYERAGQSDKVKECNAIIDGAISACENTSSPEEKLVNAVVVVLDSRAYKFAPIKVPYQHMSSFTLPGNSPDSVSEADFKAAERLKLRAAALADRLPADSNTRRHVHRDLAVWYQLLGRKQLASEERNTLYKLVGVESESILNPQVGGCGMLVWWQKDPIAHNFDCGMG